MVAIKAIRELKKFASFEEFLWNTNGLKNFQKYNLFYGLNGSGKTTLSRLMYFLSLGKIPDSEQFSDLKQLEFKIELNDETTIKSLEENPLKGKIKVFNNDFINNNIQFEKATTNSLMYNIGEASIKLKKQKKNIENLLKKNNDFLKEIQDKSNKTSENNNKTCQELAKKIRDILGLPPSFNLSKIKPLLDSNDPIQPFDLHETDRQRLISIYRQETPSDIYFDFGLMNENYLKEETFRKIKNTLSTKKQRKTGEKENIIQWISDGLHIHENEHTKCKFCGKVINESEWEIRLQEIKEILQKDCDFEKFELEVKELQNNIAKKIEFIENFNINIHSNQFLVEFQADANKILQDLPEKKKLYKRCLETINASLKNKLSNLDIEVETIDKTELSFLLECIHLKDLIERNNTEIKNANTKKEEAKETIINYYVYPFFEDYNKNKQWCKKAEKKIEYTKQRIKDLHKKDEALQRELSSQSKACEKIEKYCDTIFGTKKFSFAYDEEKSSYIIKRVKNNSIARNISEGEKTIIAFSFFVSSLLEKDFNIQDGIVVIDDPISSLDQEYLFNIYILIAREIFEKQKPNQAFILTHNFYFFKKIRNCIINLVKKLGDTKKGDFDNIDFSVYSIEKTNDKSTILNATKYLLNYESEYLHLIRKLNKDLVDYQENDEFQDVGIGNAIRQVLEIFLSFKMPAEKNLYTRFAAVKPEDKFKYLYDMVNSFSHAEELDSEVFDSSFKKQAGIKEINELFEFIKTVDDKHYDCIKKVL